MADLVDEGAESGSHQEGLADIEAGLVAVFAVAGERQLARGVAIAAINQQIVGLRDYMERLASEGGREDGELNRQRDAARREVERRLAWGEVGLEQAFPLIALTADRTPPSQERTAAILETAKRLVAIKPGDILLVDSQSGQDRPQALVATERLMPSATRYAISARRPAGGDVEVGGLLNPMVREEKDGRIVPCTKIYAGVEQIGEATKAAIDASPEATEAAPSAAPGWVVSLNELGLKLEDVGVDRARILKVTYAIEKVLKDPLCTDRAQVRNAIAAAFIRRQGAHPSVIVASLREMILDNLGAALDDAKGPTYNNAVASLRSKLQAIAINMGLDEFRTSEQWLSAILTRQKFGHAMRE